MGDFLVDSKELKKTFGIKLLEADNHELRSLLSSVSDSEVAAELAENEQKFAKGEDINEENYLYNPKACLAVRKWIEKHNLDAFSVNFLKIRDKTIDSMPFIEACKAMERGIGYAGEGDALTAAFVGAFFKSDSRYVVYRNILSRLEKRSFVYKPYGGNELWVVGGREAYSL